MEIASIYVAFSTSLWISYWPMISIKAYQMLFVFAFKAFVVILKV